MGQSERDDARNIHLLLRRFKGKIFKTTGRDAPSTVSDFMTVANSIEQATPSRGHHFQQFHGWYSVESQQLFQDVDGSVRYEIRGIAQEER